MPSQRKTNSLPHLAKSIASRNESKNAYAGLVTLKDGPQIVIKWSPSPEIEETRQIICEGLPKAMLAYFTTVLGGQPSGGETPTMTASFLIHNDANDEVTSITFGGCTKAAYLTIFKWMRESCDGSGLALFPAASFPELVHVKHASQIMGATIPLRIVEARLIRFATVPIPLADIRNFCKSTSLVSDVKMRDLIVLSIGLAILEDRLGEKEAYSKYGTTENPAFYEAVGRYLAKNKKPDPPVNSAFRIKRILA